ncbi:hypothetical protein [Loktanella sp. Alg231-35]|uniref:hypothetical protein n=1 Tax=Loktanella sp. Alg231-35 TaxID=1922220 RepID=UPI000D54FA2A|nr:hypothetical protein [Loktanella sp. Alg231-35]
MRHFSNLLVLTCLCPSVGLAQEADPGGVFFTFDFSQEFEASTDSDLVTEEVEDGLVSTTSLDFEAVTETRTQRLAFELGTDLRIDEDDIVLDSNTVGLTYARTGADAEFEASLAFQRADISFLRDITDFIGDDGVIVLPDDIDELTGSGFRNTSTFATSLSWNETAPIGYSFGVGVETLRYEDASTALVDSDMATVDVGVRFDLSAVITANVALGFERLEEDGEAAENTQSLSTALTFDRPLGDLTARLTASRDDDGDTFWAAVLERSFAVPGGNFEGALGVAEDEVGDAQVTARLSYDKDIPSGLVSVSAERDVGAGADSGTTTLQASYERDLSPITNIRFGFDFGQSEEFDSDTTIATGGVSIRYGYELTPLWELNVGARADARDDDGLRTNSSTIFLSLDRVYSWRP